MKMIRTTNPGTQGHSVQADGNWVHSSRKRTMTTNNLVPIEHHNRLTAGPAAWTDTRVPADVFSVAQSRLRHWQRRRRQTRLSHAAGRPLEAGAGLIPMPCTRHMSHYTGRVPTKFCRERASHQGVPAHLSGLSTARLGEKAMDVEGGPLSGYLPLFIGVPRADAYDRITMRHLPQIRFASCQGLLDSAQAQATAQGGGP